MPARFSRFYLFLFLASALVTAQVRHLRRRLRKIFCVQIAGIRMTERQPFWESVCERAPSRIPQDVGTRASPMAYRRSLVHENSFAVREILSASVRTLPYAYIYYTARSDSRRLAYVPSSLSLRHKPSPAWAFSVHVSRERGSVIRLLSSTATWHSTPSDLWIPSYRAWSGRSSRGKYPRV